MPKQAAVIIMAEQALESSAIAADLIRQEVEGLAVPHDGNEPLGVVTISAGVAALTPGEDKTTDKLLKEADAALYRAKESGRNCVVVSSTEEALKRPI
jgi:two-component system, cell cycle response regulator